MQVKEDELRKVLSPAGFVWEVTVPRSPDGATHTPHSSDFTLHASHCMHLSPRMRTAVSLTQLHALLHGEPLQVSSLGLRA